MTQAKSKSTNRGINWSFMMVDIFYLVYSFLERI